MSDLIISGLHPELAAKARDHKRLAAALGIQFLFTSGTRRWEEQISLYRKGREPSPDGWHVTDPRKVVTFALPNQCAHVRSAAYDVVPMVEGRAVWDRLDLFGALGRIGKDLGLTWGGDWPKLRDLPHFELPFWRSLPMPEEKE